MSETQATESTAAPAEQVHTQSTTNPNENTATEAQTQEIQGGEAPISFDDLDRAHATSQTKAEKRQAAKEEKTDGKESKNAGSEEKEQKTAEKDDFTDEKSSEVLDEAESGGKLIKVKAGERNVNLTPDAMVPVKWNGEELEVPFQEVLNSYSGAKEIQRRFTEVDKEKQTLTSQRDEYDKTLGHIYNLAQHEDPQQLMDFLVKSAGGNPELYMARMVEHLTPQVKEWMEMPDADRKARLLDLKEQELLQQQSAFSERQEYDNSIRELETQAQQLIQELGVTDNDFGQAYQEMVDLGLGADSPDDVANYLDGKTIYNGITQLIDSLSPGYEEKEALADKMYAEIENNENLDWDDIQGFLKDFFNEESVETKVNERIKGHKEVKSESSSKSLNPGQDFIDWDSFDDAHN